MGSGNKPWPEVTVALHSPDGAHEAKLFVAFAAEDERGWLWNANRNPLRSSVSRSFLHYLPGDYTTFLNAEKFWIRKQQQKNGLHLTSTYKS